jgi:hypothetical protein
LYAALQEKKTMIVTQDFLRDHKYCVRGVGLMFRRWLESKKIAPLQIESKNKIYLEVL